MKRALPLFVVLTALAASAGTVVEEAVARINNAVITRSEYNRSRQQLLEEARQQGVNADDPRFLEQERNTLRDLIDLQLLVQKAGDLGYTADAEVIKRLDEMRKSMNLESMEDLEKAAEQQGINFQDFRENMKQQMLRQMVVSREVGGNIDITSEDVRKYYEANKDKFAQAETVRLSEILIPTQTKDAEGKATDLGPVEIAGAQAQANEILAQLKAGAKFEELAQKYSKGATALTGGDIGTFKRGTLAKQLEDATFPLKAGETTGVIQTKQGFIILKVTEHTPAGVPTPAEADMKIREAIYYERLQPALRAYLTKLREEAFIDIKQGYVDSGASPNQTRPVITAAAPDPKDKKKD